MDLFEYSARKATAAGRPLAERMRPRNLSEFRGHETVVGPASMLGHAIAKDRIFSMILWGPPGCGKTTLARIIAGETRSHFAQFSAVLSGVKEIRSVIDEAQRKRTLQHRRTILFVDEIHRFNKAQQDAFLHHVESGLITLIGATTENPSFEVIAPLLSRCRVIVLQSLTAEDLKTIIQSALEDKERGLGNVALELTREAVDYLVQIADGDARAALNGLEIAASLVLPDAEAEPSPPVPISLQDLEKAMQRRAPRYDKGGEEHYNLISAFHKSLRGSDPDASLYWLARMLLAGEDPFYVARRMVRFASEDVGNADPQALAVALGAMESFRFLGHPEGELALAQAAVYLATAPKSNRIYTAYGKVRSAIEESGTLPVPMHIRNAPTRLMKGLGYGKGYQYPHDFKEALVVQSYLPDKLQGRSFYTPTDHGFEKQIKERLEKWRRLQKRPAASPAKE
jgi:putative ATPase